MRVPSPRSIASLLIALALLATACGAAATPSPSPDGGPATPAPSGPVGESPAPVASGSPAPTAPPSVGELPLGGERLNLLLVGLDNTTERDPSELTDSLIVASLDPVAGTVSLMGLPRDLTDFPLPSGQTYRQKLNAMYVEIQANPERYGGTAGEEPLDVLARAVGGIVDLPIEHWAVIDMDGFAAMIDELGGVDVYVEDAICDPGYHQLGVRGFEAGAGWWHMTGPQALGLGRIRKDAGGSDFQRMRRQQDLLVAVREAIVANGAEADPLGWLGRVPAIRTNLPPDQLVAAAAILARVPAERFYSRLVQPFGRGGTELYDERGYVLSANMDEIREAAGLLFTTPGERVTTGRQDPPPEKPATVPDLPRFNGC